jgi:hypothetical protein
MKFHLFRRIDGQWGWHLVARNGRIVAASGEGYVSRAHARKMVAKVIGLAADTPVVQD